MKTMKTTIALVTSIGLAASVTIGSCIWPENPDFCEGHPDEADCKPPIDAPFVCTSDEQCTTPTAVCELASGACVQCTASDASACSGTSPVCSADHTCRACEAHDECASAACLPDGACADEANVAYVAPNGGGTACTLAAPCADVAAALATARAYIKVTGAIDEAITIDGDRVVTFLGAPGAKLTRENNGPLLTIEDAANVSIYDLEISGALGTNVGISIPVATSVRLQLTRVTVSNNAGGGISASSGTATVAQSTVSNNAGGGISASSGTVTVSQSTVSNNAGGGISINGAQFDITNSIIVGNGSGSALLGGVKIDGVGPTAASPHRLDFNTISANLGPATLNTGVTCGTVLTELTFSNNIIYGNIVAGGGTQIGGSANCKTSYSDVGPDDVAGTGNLNADPLFIDAAGGDFHIAATSPAKDAADPAATLATDFDGEQRPQGAVRDIGADEVTP